jgi:hypothetical protein
MVDVYPVDHGTKFAHDRSESAPDQRRGTELTGGKFSAALQTPPSSTPPYNVHILTGNGAENLARGRNHRQRQHGLLFAR